MNFYHQAFESGKKYVLVLVSWISQFGNNLAPPKSPRAGISLRRSIHRNRAGRRNKIDRIERLFQKYVVESSRSSPRIACNHGRESAPATGRQLQLDILLSSSMCRLIDLFFFSSAIALCAAGRSRPGWYCFFSSGRLC